eukprot:897093-Rhodomonas_salina.1
MWEKPHRNLSSASGCITCSTTEPNSQFQQCEGATTRHYFALLNPQYRRWSYARRDISLSTRECMELIVAGYQVGGSRLVPGKSSRLRGTYRGRTRCLSGRSPSGAAGP